MIVFCSYAQGAEKKQPFFLLLIHFVDRIPLWINFNFISIKQFFCCEKFKLFLQKIFFSLQTIGNFGCTQLGFNLQSCSSIRGNLQQSYELFQTLRNFGSRINSRREESKQQFARPCHCCQILDRWRRFFWNSPKILLEIDFGSSLLFRNFFIRDCFSFTLFPFVCVKRKVKQPAEISQRQIFLFTSFRFHPFGKQVQDKT